MWTDIDEQVGACIELATRIDARLQEARKGYERKPNMALADAELRQLLFRANELDRHLRQFKLAISAEVEQEKENK